MEQQITRAELKRILQPGMKLALVDCLIGPVPEANQPREVVKQTSYGVIMRRPDGRESDLRFEAGERYTRAGRTLTIYQAPEPRKMELKIAARYVIQETA